MGMAVSVVTAPTAEPVSLDELTTWLRESDTTQNDLIRGLGMAARRLIERTYDCALVTQTLKLTIDRFPIPTSPYLWQQYSWGYWSQRIPMMNLTGSWWPERACIFIPRPPLQSVSSIQYIAQDGTTQTLASNQYTVDTQRMPGRVVPGYGLFWPFTLPTMNAVSVTYVAGYGSPPQQLQGPTAIPETIKLAIKFAVNFWYENREQPGDVLPEGARKLLMSEWDGSYY